MCKEYEVYKEQVIEESINKITTKMNDLFGLPENDKQKARRRWIWELIQNASDCASNNGVSIKIETNENELIFSHDGAIFTSKNLLDLVTQMSSKRYQTNDKTGKFGTGFISTHLISPKIRINGLYKSTDDDTETNKLDIVIDRSNLSVDSLRANIEQLLTALENKELGVNQSVTDFNTNFVYWFDGDENAQKATDEGIKDLDLCIGYVLAFNPKIKQVQHNLDTYYVGNTEKLQNNIVKTTVIKYNEISKKTENRAILSNENDDVIVATEVSSSNVGQECKDITKIPRIFCQFPLVGTEMFPFPLVINSKDFEISQERNSIHENDNNSNIISEAKELYSEMLDYVNQTEFTQLFNVCKMVKPYTSSFKNSLQENTYTDVKKIYIKKILVPCLSFDEFETKINYNHDDENNFLIPYSLKDASQNDFWELIHRLNTKPLVIKSEYLEWANILTKGKMDENIVFEHLLNKDMYTQEKLAKFLENDQELFMWLNDFYKICIDNKIDIPTILNQSDSFSELSKVKIDTGIDEKLKDILIKFGEQDLRTNLINKNINTTYFTSNNICIVEWNDQIIADKISRKVREMLSQEAAGDRSDQVKCIFNELTKWFESNQVLAKELFKDIYENRYLLTPKEEMVRRLDLADKVEQAVTNANIDVEQALAVIEQYEKIINREGVISGDEEKSLLINIANSSIYAKEKVDNMINRSIEEVYKELNSNPRYTICDTVSQWRDNKFSATVFKAKRDGKDIRIVIRPSDENKIIFYDDIELDALDDTDYELWTCDEFCNVRMLTLGDILKTTGITAIPLKKI